MAPDTKHYHIIYHCLLRLTVGRKLQKVNNIRTNKMRR